MAKKQDPIINITGVNQIASIVTTYSAKQQAATAKEHFDTCRDSLIKMLTPKIYKLWVQNLSVMTGKIVLSFVYKDRNDKDRNGEEHITVQNRQNSVRFMAKDTAEVLRKLNDDISEDKQLTPKDIFKIETTRVLNPIVMAHPKIKEKITAHLISIEAELKKEGVLAPEVSLFIEDKQIGLTDIAIPRLLVLSKNFEGAMETIGNPVVINVVTKKEEK